MPDIGTKTDLLLSPYCVLVLQGGRPLGAYQAGVFESLSTVYTPDSARTERPVFKVANSTHRTSAATRFSTVAVGSAAIADSRRCRAYAW